MYKEALRINPSNAIAMTNLAQTLLIIDTSDSILEAERWISKAASCADRRFRWWRNVREQICERKLSLKGLQPQVAEIGKRLHSPKHLSDLHYNFTHLKNTEDHQHRGYQLEILVRQLFQISLGNSFGSYRTSPIWSSPSMQIDAAFSYFDKDFYRVETKWTSNLTTAKEIVLFRDKLDVAGIKGLFISISGFMDEAIQKARELRKEVQIILMDGGELELVLQGSPTFDEAIRLKQIYFNKESNPYFRIKPTVQT